jgi:hypothetical protein
MPRTSTVLLSVVLASTSVLSAMRADAAVAKSPGQICSPSIVASDRLVSAAERYAAGQIAQPPLTDQADGFAWPDTPFGVIRTENGYDFFGSDGGYHAEQEWHGQWYGNDKYGSITRTLGTLENPLGAGPPIDVTIRPNADPGVNPNYSSYDYLGGGPVYRVPPGSYGDDSLLLVYHAEVPTIGTQSFLSVLGLASSTDGGMSWTDLGEIIRVNQAYRSDLDGFDIGDPPLAVSPDGKFFLIYFRDWLANGTTHWKNSITLVSAARAPIASVLAEAFGPDPHAAHFEKYYQGTWDHQPGIGGLSSDLNPQAAYGGESQVAYDSAIRRYVMIIGEGVLIAYSESADGIHWTLPVLLFDFRSEKDMPNIYELPVGEGWDPSMLGETFYIYYTKYPTAGPDAGWAGATVNRFTVACG